MKSIILNDKFDDIELVITDLSIKIPHNSGTKIINYGHSGIIQNLRRYAP